MQPGDHAALARTVLVVDDHRTVTELLALAVSSHPQLSCVESALSAQQAMDRLRTTRVDVVVMDYRLGETDGIEATRMVTQRWPDTAVVMLTAYPTRFLMREAAAAGASALLPKDGRLTDLLDTVLAAVPRRFVVAPALLQALMAEAEPRSNPLTPRENDVLHQMARGLDVRGISRALDISVHTCRSHVKAILGKLDAHSQLEAVAHAHRDGLLDLVDG